MTLHATYRPVRPQRPHHARKRATMRPRAGEKSCNQRLSFAAKKPQPRLHCSQQFSTVALTTSSATIAERYAYSAYGAPTVCSASGTDIGSSAKDNRITYTGREWDQTLRLYHFRARLYDAGVGRFLGRDPIGFRGSKWQLYKFLGCKPLRYVDPIGHQESDFDIILAMPPIVVLPPELIPPLVLPIFPGPPYFGPIKGDCQSVRSSLRPSLSPIIARLLECNVNIYCGECGGFDAVALPGGPNGHGHICLNEKKIDGQDLFRIHALIIHEGTHITQFLEANKCACKKAPYRGPNPTIRGGVGGTNCKVCEAEETPAYRNQAEYLYPSHLPDADAFYDAWVDAGICISCASPCNRLQHECPPLPEIPFPL